MEQAIEVASSALACKVGVVGRRNETDSLRCTGKHVAYSIRQSLEGIRGEAILVMDDIVMRRSGGPVETSMGLQEKVEIVHRCDATIDDRPRFWVSVAVGLLLVGRVESSMVTFSLIETR